MSTQPGTGLAVFNPGAALPAHVAQFFEEQGGNIVPRTTVPSLMLTGKVWQISIDGNKTPLQRRNTDGDLEPLPTFKGIVLDYNKQRGRSFYEGEYDPNNTSQPLCWSTDGVAPDPSLPGPFSAEQIAAMSVDQRKASRKICATCATCPNAVKGSKITPQGKATVACGEHRMIAVFPDPQMGLPEAMRRPLRLKIAVTSDWDKQSPDQEQAGWLAWSNYVDWLNARGCKHTAVIVTKMKFDHDAAYPKIFFSAERALEPAELAQVGPLLHSDDVKKLLSNSYTPSGADGIPTQDQVVAQAPVVTDAVAPAAAPPVNAAPAPNGIPSGYKLADDQYSYDQYLASGWTNDTLIANGKLIAVAAPAVVEQVVVAPPPAPAQEAVVVVGEQTPAAATVATPVTSTPSTTSAPAVVASEAVVVETAPSPTIAAPAAEVHQEPAQASAPVPVSAPPAPEPPAAASAAATVTGDVSTNVPGELEDLLGQWS